MALRKKASDLVPDKDRLSAPVAFWLDEIAASRKREKSFRDDGKHVRDIYSANTAGTIPFNIVFSNIETMAPALYSQVPRPVVRARFRTANPVAPHAARAAQTMLEFLLETNIEGYDTFDECLKSVTLDGLLPGRGVSSVKYEAEVTGEENDYRKTPGSELVCPEILSWDRVYFGFARKWSKVPWIAYEHHIDRKEAIRLFGKDSAAKIRFTKGEEREGDGEGGMDTRFEDERNIGARKTALIYQIWDKDGGRKIRYISPQYKEGYLKVSDDELNITGFFNCPRPLQFVYKTNDTVPTSIYKLYEQQAEELNELTRRITRITKSIKARGAYDPGLGEDIKRVMEEDDNALLPAEQGSSLAAEKGFQNAIWFMPLEMLITTLRELVAAREQCKQVIYEITGISDILRGASKASETLGAQQIKNQWGTLRIKPKQGEVQRFACDLMRIALEIAAQKFSEETWAKMTGLPFLTTEQIQQGQQALQAAQQQLQQVSAQAQQFALLAQQHADTAQQAQMPEQQQAIQANQQAAQQQVQQISQQLQSTPKWPEILAALKDDLQRSYSIDIETNSTIEPEAAEDQKNITDMLGALAQVTQGLSPLIASGVMPFQAAQAMIMAIVKRFRFGDEIEEFVNQMQPPKDTGEAEKKQQELQNQLQQKDQQAQSDKLAAATKAAQDAHQTQDLQSQIKAKDVEAGQKDRETDLASREQKLKNDRALFLLEQKHAVESIAINGKAAQKELDAKKQITDIKDKKATDTHKQAQHAQQQAHQAQQQVDKAAADTVGQMKDILGEMKDVQREFLKDVSLLQALSIKTTPTQSKA